MKTTTEFFNFQAPLYDAYQRSCVPKYEEMIQIVARCLRRFLSSAEDLRVIDLGCGTGNTTAELAKLLPRASFTCVDASQEMLSGAQSKLAGVPVEFHRLDLEEDAWEERWPEQRFHAAVSVLVLEHLPFDSYRSVLSRVRRVLVSGGWFVSVEALNSDLNQQLYFDEMAEWEERALAAGIISREWLAEMRALSAENEHHYFATVEQKRQWWIQAGFADMEVVWQYYCVAALVGRKP